jgi:transketolase
MKATFIKTISDLMDQHDDTLTVTADMGFSVFEDLQRRYPKRFINTGVTEQATVSIAAGLAMSGYKVFFYAQAAFATMRCFEQLHLDAGYNNTNIKVIGVNAGFSLNQLGVSHFSVEDVGIVRTLPSFTIFTPSNAHEMSWALNESYKIEGPTYLRYSKLDEAIKSDTYPHITLGKPVEIMKGTDAVLFASGGIMRYAKEVTSLLRKKNIYLALYSVPTIKPFDSKYLQKITKNVKAVYTLEEHSIIGGLGSTIAEILAETPGAPVLHRFGIPDKYTGITGSLDYLLAYNDLSPHKIAASITKHLLKI